MVVSIGRLFSASGYFRYFRSGGGKKAPFPLVFRRLWIFSADFPPIFTLSGNLHVPAEKKSPPFSGKRELWLLGMVVVAFLSLSSSSLGVAVRYAESSEYLRGNLRGLPW